MSEFKKVDTFSLYNAVKEKNGSIFGSYAVVSIWTIVGRGFSINRTHSANLGSKEGSKNRTSALRLKLYLVPSKVL